MNTLLIVLIVAGSLLLGPGIETHRDPWSDGHGPGVGGHSASDSGDPWSDRHGPGAGGPSSCDSSYGAGSGGNDGAKGKPM